MKVEIEVTQEMIQDAITRHVRKAISNWSFGGLVDQAIKEAMDSEIGAAVRAEARKLLVDSEGIKSRVDKAVTAAIKRAIK